MSEIVEKTKRKLSTDKKILTLSIISFAAILLRIIHLIIISVGLYSGYYSGTSMFWSISELIPAFLTFFFILFSYKSKDNRLLIFALFVHALMYVIDFISASSNYDSYFFATTLSLAFFVSMLVFTTKGTKNINIPKIICIVELSLISIRTIVIFRYFSVITLLNSASSILFVIILLKTLPNIIKIKETALNKTQALLTELKTAYKNNLISEDEYIEKKADILKSL